MKRKKRDKRHLLVGILLVIAGVFFVFGGLTQNSFHQNIDSDGAITILNQGGELEGHTPRGFSGSGTGLFVGDNLNSGFPEGDGVRTFLHFDLTQIQGEKIKSAVLYTDNVEVRGTPFKDLGPLEIKGVEYEVFSPKIWNREGGETICEIETSSGELSCDVSDYIRKELLKDKATTQLVLEFKESGDFDGMLDMVFFYKTDTNTNEEGIFALRINNPEDQDPPLPEDAIITIPIVLHRVVDSGELSTKRSQDNILSLFEESMRIWNQANVQFEVTIRDTSLDGVMQEHIKEGSFRNLYSLTTQDSLSFHTYFFNSIGGPNGIAFPPLLSVVADTTTVPDFRAQAHEIGHLLGLEHTSESQNRLLFQGADGELLTPEEIKEARIYAEEFIEEIERRDE